MKKCRQQTLRLKKKEGQDHPYIIESAKIAEIDPIYYEKDFHAVPDTRAEKVYRLLRQAFTN